MNITFHDKPPTYVFERDSLRFDAYADGTRVTCLISIEALIGPDNDVERAKEAFELKKDDLHRVARVLMEKGEFIKGDIVITTGTLRDLTD